MIFDKIALALTLSPNCKALIEEAVRLKKLFGSELIFIHAGETTENDSKKFADLFQEAGLQEVSYKLIWQKGDPVKVILDICSEEKIDLLIAGALEKEDLFKYYSGSVARTLMREAPCSILFYTDTKSNISQLKKFCVSIDFSKNCETVTKKAFEFAKLEKAEEFVLLYELQLPGLASSIYDSGSTIETEEKRADWLNEEELKMEMFANELNLTGINLKKVCLYGKQGWEAGNYIRENHSDIFVVSFPERRLNFIDRVFRHDLEFIFKQLPCPLLIVKTGN